jgi:biotin carboxyl carrier protein
MYEITVNGQPHQLHRENNHLFLNGKALTLDLARIDENRIHLLLNNRSYTVELMSREAKTLVVRVNGQRYELFLRTELDLMLEKLGLNQLADSKVNEVKAPMPGLVLRLIAEVGQEVKKGDPLLVLESMKMENVLKSPGAGTVDKVLVSPGNAVEKGQTLVRFG